jgi:hypothetical protein
VVTGLCRDVDPGLQVRLIEERQAFAVHCVEPLWAFAHARALCTAGDSLAAPWLRAQGATLPWITQLVMAGCGSSADAVASRPPLREAATPSVAMKRAGRVCSDDHEVFFFVRWWSAALVANRPLQSNGVRPTLRIEDPLTHRRGCLGSWPCHHRRALYGREDLVERVARARAPVLVVTGDSGVGKSEVLRSAQARSGAAIAPTPVALDGSPGNLQRAVFAGLVSALVEITERRSLHGEIGELVRDAALRLARDRASELSKALGAELLSYLRHKLGPEAGRAIIDFVKQLKEAQDSDIGARINAACDPSIAQTIVALAGELVGLAQGEPMLLALDRAESMTPADGGVLRDLAETLPPGVRLRVAMATFTGEQATAAKELLASGIGVQEVAVSGLDIEAVSAWLRDVDLERLPPPVVHRLTGGYPLLIQSVIANVQAGGDLTDAPLHQRFAAQTELSWDAVDPTARAVARRLAVLPQPLPPRECAQLCEMDMSEFGDAVERLRSAFIMSSVVNDRPWFHEQRRAFVYQLLSPEERGDVCAAAARAALDHLKATNDLGWVQPLAELLAGATPLHAADDLLAAAFELSRAELAVCAAAIERAEKQHEFVVSGDAVLRHARAWFEADGDLVASLRQLSDRGLVALKEQAFSAVLRPRWSVMTLVALQGRAAPLQRRGALRASSAVCRFRRSRACAWPWV